MLMAVPGEHEGFGLLLFAVQKSERRVHPLRAWLEGVKNGGEKGASLPCPRAGGAKRASSSSATSALGGMCVFRRLGGGEPECPDLLAPQSCGM